MTPTIAEREHRWVPTDPDDDDDTFVWFRCRDCPGDHRMRMRRPEMGGRKDDTTVSTCPRCGNYTCTGTCTGTSTGRGRIAPPEGGDAR